MLVSLELPGNIKVWLRCQCQVIFLWNNLCPFITTVKTERRESALTQTWRQRRFSKTCGVSSLKQEHWPHTNLTGSDLTFPPVRRDPRWFCSPTVKEWSWSQSVWTSSKCFDLSLSVLTSASSLFPNTHQSPCEADSLRLIVKSNS